MAPRDTSARLGDRRRRVGGPLTAGGLAGDCTLRVRDCGLRAAHTLLPCRPMRRIASKWLVGLSVLAGLTACAVGEEDAADEAEEEGDYVDPGFDMGKFDTASTVDAFVRSTCSTVPVRGLSMQIAEELRCLAPGLLVPFEQTTTVRFASDAVLPFLETTTAEAVTAAAPAVGSITINSGLRSLPQQFLLYRWAQQGRCGVRVAASPGRSNHETGRALDLANSAEARKVMAGRGFSSIASDPVHFDHLASPDLRDLGVQAFQRLWNRNHPEDRISEDGAYGPQTASRVAQAPAAGFALGGCK
jgi:hypothetical protein